jgi:hypothetical protein
MVGIPLDPFVSSYFPDRKIKRLPGLRSLSRGLLGLGGQKNKILRFLWINLIIVGFYQYEEECAHETCYAICGPGYPKKPIGYLHTHCSGHIVR